MSDSLALIERLPATVVFVATQVRDILDLGHMPRPDTAEFTNVAVFQSRQPESDRRRLSKLRVFLSGIGSVLIGHYPGIDVLDRRNDVLRLLKV